MSKLVLLREIIFNEEEMQPRESKYSIFGVKKYTKLINLKKLRNLSLLSMKYL
jgi:hypothetical protein